MAEDKIEGIYTPFIHFKCPPEHPAPNETYYNFEDTYNSINNHNASRINNNEMKYIVKRHSRKC